MDGIPENPSLQIALDHGSMELLPSYLSFAEEAVGDLGLRLKISSDFDRLKTINNQFRYCWPKILPSFDPAYCHLRSENAFWTEAVNEAGDTVATSAARLYDHGDRTLAADLRELRVFYDNPNEHANDSKVEVDAPFTESACGRLLFSAVVWIRPDYRRCGLSSIMPRVTRAYAVARWNVPVFWMLIKPELHRGGVTRAYGPWSMGGRIKITLPFLRIELLIAYMKQDILLKDLTDIINQAGFGASRCTDSPIANSSPRLFQGKRTRS